jgi:hypothetical protein
VESVHPLATESQFIDIAEASSSAVPFQVSVARAAALARFRGYKQQALATQSTSHIRLQIALSIIVLVLAICLVVVFAVAVSILGRYSAQLQAIRKIELTTMYLHSFPLFARITSNAIIKNDTGALNSAKYHFVHWQERSQGTFTELWDHFHGETFAPIYNAFFRDQIPVRLYLPQDGSYRISNFSLWDYLNEVQSRAKAVISADFPTSLFGEAIEVHPDFRFFADNGPRDHVLDAIQRLRDGFKAQIHYTTLQINIALGTTFSIAVVVTTVLASLLFFTATMSIRREQAEVLRILLEIPKRFISELAGSG